MSETRKTFSLWDRAVALLFPNRCLLCGRPVDGNGAFCQSCQGKAPQAPPPRHIETGEGHSLPCFAPLPYEGGVRKTLYRFKFRGKRCYGATLARLMAKMPVSKEAFDCIAFVPMSRSHQRKRGYNQSELLAKALGKELALPVEALLEKAGENRTQHNLPARERRRNVAGVYHAAGCARDKRVLLIDDIITTGSTLAECAKVLYRAGAKTVCALCAANAELGRHG